MDKDKKDLFKTVLLLSVPSILGLSLAIGLVYMIYGVNFSIVKNIIGLDPHSPRSTIIPGAIDVDKNRAVAVLGDFFTAVNEGNFSDAAYYAVRDKRGLALDVPYRDYCPYNCSDEEFSEAMNNTFPYSGTYGMNYDFLSKYGGSMVIISVEKQRDGAYRVSGYRSSSSVYYVTGIVNGRIQFIRKP